MHGFQQSLVNRQSSLIYIFQNQQKCSRWHNQELTNHGQLQSKMFFGKTSYENKRKVKRQVPIQLYWPV